MNDALHEQIFYYYGMTKEHFEKLERMYLTAPLNQEVYTTTTIKIGEGKAEIGWQVSGKLFHAMGALHGSAYFKMLDDAAFFAANSLVEDVAVLTTNFNIQLVRPVQQGSLKAQGRVRFKSSRLWIAESTLYNDEGKEVAFGTGHFMKSKLTLSAAMGYK